MSLPQVDLHKLICFFCKGITTKKNIKDWEIDWLKNCSESLSKLLDVELLTPSFFQSQDYCTDCITLIRNADFTARTISALQKQQELYRNLISKYLLNQLESTEDLVKTEVEDTVSETVKSEDGVEDNEDFALQIDGNAITEVTFEQSIIFEETNQGTESTVANDQTQAIQVRFSKRLQNRISYREEGSHANSDENFSEEESNASMSEEDTEDEICSAKKPRISSGPRKRNERGRRVTKAESIETTKSEKKNSEEEFINHITTRRLWKIPEQVLENTVSLFVQKLIESRSEAFSKEAEIEPKLLAHLLRCEIEEKYKLRNTYICNNDNCEARYNRIHFLKKHLAEEHRQELDVNPFECFVCNTRHPTTTTLNVHYRHKHEQDETPYHCEAPGCKSMYSQGENLHWHMRQNHREEFSAMRTAASRKAQYLQYRDTAAIRDENYRGKRQSATKVLKFICTEPKCTFRAEKEHSLVFHRIEVHEKRLGPYPCSCCGREYKSRMSYNNHILSKTKKLQCALCGRTFISLSSFTTHMALKHKDAETFNCSFCGQKFFREEDVPVHEKLHTADTGFNCLISSCVNPNFESIEELRAHVSGPSHDIAQKMLVCHICGYVSKGHMPANRMRLHMRTHTGESPYKCKFCEKSFKSQTNLTTHEEIHHADLIEKKTYACKQCDATFSVAQYLFKHNAWHKHGKNACRPIAKKR